MRHVRRQGRYARPRHPQPPRRQQDARARPASWPLGPGGLPPRLATLHETGSRSPGQLAAHSLESPTQKSALQLPRTRTQVCQLQAQISGLWKTPTLAPKAGSALLMRRSVFPAAVPLQASPSWQQQQMPPRHCQAAPCPPQLQQLSICQSLRRQLHPVLPAAHRVRPPQLSPAPPPAAAAAAAVALPPLPLQPAPPTSVPPVTPAQQATPALAPPRPLQHWWPNGRRVETVAVAATVVAKWALGPPPWCQGSQAEPPRLPHSANLARPHQGAQLRRRTPQRQEQAEEEDHPALASR
mmetsp:Transcript_116107/g.289983  ORF Transcript_116107/g.289983 Transcript_116107/m.289983 type:complete len:297 (+) Transcript_116107:1156-2046(+)